MRIVLGAMAALAIMTGSAAAEVQPAATASASPVNAKKLELVRRYMADLKIEQLVNSMVTQMTGALTSQILDNEKGATAAQKAAVQDAIRESMAEIFPDFIQKVLHESEAVYADVFTEQELTDLVAFYESPTGRSLIEKTPQAALRVNQKVIAYMPEFQGRMRAAMIKHLCDKGMCPPKENSKSKK